MRRVSSSSSSSALSPSAYLSAHSRASSESPQMKTRRGAKQEGEEELVDSERKPERQHVPENAFARTNRNSVISLKATSPGTMYNRAQSGSPRGQTSPSKPNHRRSRTQSNEYKRPDPTPELEEGEILDESPPRSVMPAESRRSDTSASTSSRQEFKEETSSQSLHLRMHRYESGQSAASLAVKAQDAKQRRHDIRSDEQRSEFEAVSRSHSRYGDREKSIRHSISTYELPSSSRRHLGASVRGEAEVRPAKYDTSQPAERTSSRRQDQRHVPMTPLSARLAERFGPNDRHSPHALLPKRSQTSLSHYSYRDEHSDGVSVSSNKPASTRAFRQRIIDADTPSSAPNGRQRAENRPHSRAGQTASSQGRPESLPADPTHVSETLRKARARTLSLRGEDTDSAAVQAGASSARSGRDSKASVEPADCVC